MLDYSGEPVKCQLLFSSYYHLYISGELVYINNGGDNMPTEKPRYTITLDEEMLQKIDDFRFENRFANRTQATLELIRLGMKALEEQQKISTSKEPGR